VIAADAAAELLAPRERQDWDEAECEEVAALDWVDRVVIAPRASYQHIPIAAEGTAEVLGAADEEEEHGRERVVLSN